MEEEEFEVEPCEEPIDTNTDVDILPESDERKKIGGGQLHLKHRPAERTQGGEFGQNTTDKGERKKRGRRRIIEIEKPQKREREGTDRRVERHRTRENSKRELRSRDTEQSFYTRAGSKREQKPKCKEKSRNGRKDLFGEGMNRADHIEFRKRHDRLESTKAEHPFRLGITPDPHRNNQCTDRHV
jgi:hypothetical protein